MSEKTERPTPRRLEEARRRGEVPSSRRWVAGVSTASAFAALLAALPRGVAHLVGWTSGVFQNAEASAPGAMYGAAEVLVRLAALPLLAAWGASLASAAALSGVRLVPALLLPKADRLSPSAGLRRMFGAKSLRRGAGGLCAGAAVLAVALTSVQGDFPAWVQATRLGGVAAGLLAIESVRAMACRCAAALVALAAADLGLAKWRHWRELRMSREEVKRDQRDAEGDPRHRQRRRAAHHQLAAGGPSRGVRGATAVVVNPTHIAVALRYDPRECDAPYLMAKGVDAAALSIRAEAMRLGVPVLVDVPLARSLLRVDVGAAVPEELYRSTAAVLAAAAPPKPPSPALWS